MHVSTYAVFNFDTRLSQALFLSHAINAKMRFAKIKIAHAKIYI